MKTIRLLLISVLASIGLAVNAQNCLPLKNSFSLGGGLMWGMSEGKGDFQDVAGAPTCGLFGAEFRPYPVPNIGLGVMFDYLSGSKDNNKLRCHYIAPALTLRGLWAENKQGFYGTVGLGYLHYKDELGYSRPFNKGYFAASVHLGYEFAISSGVGMQIRADIIMSDFKDKGYRSCCGDYSFADNYESALSYFSIGLALVFGK